MDAPALDDPGALTAEKRAEALKKVNEYVAKNLRAASWSEVGADLFFVGVNAVVVAFCAVLWFFGAVPPLATCATLSLSWIGPIFLVNWLVCWTGYAGYECVYFFPLSRRTLMRARPLPAPCCALAALTLRAATPPLPTPRSWMFSRYKELFGAKPTKFNPLPYEDGQLLREMFYTMLSMGFASCWEVLVLHLWATRYPARVYEAVGGAPLWQFAGSFLLLGLWSDFHFYCVHRLLHTSLLYNPLGIPIHKLHHMSNNPGPWSGMSMHPVESILYLSKIAGVLLIPAHPLHLLFLLFNATLMPIPGHSGHLEALGNEYHWIHHHCFSFNYGSPSVPLDKLFGTHFQFAKPAEAKKAKGA